MYCICKNWESGSKQIKQAEIFAYIHGQQEYTGEVFKYCPWCGQLLLDEGTHMSKQLGFDDLEEIELVCSCGAYFFKMLSKKDMFRRFLDDTEYLCPKCEHRKQSNEPDQLSAAELVGGLTGQS